MFRTIETSIHTTASRNQDMLIFRFPAEEREDGKLETKRTNQNKQSHGHELRATVTKT